MAKMSAKRINEAVTALVPLLPAPAMVRVFLTNQGWSAEEIEAHQAAVTKALAEKLVKGQS